MDGLKREGRLRRKPFLLMRKAVAWKDECDNFSIILFGNKVVFCGFTTQWSEMKKLIFFFTSSY